MKNRRWNSAVWIVKRHGKTGTSYRLRWQDRAGKWHSKTCGQDISLARRMRDRKREELRAGAAGEYPELKVSDFVNQLDTLMAGRAENTIKKTKLSVRRLDEVCGPLVLDQIDRAVVLTFRGKRLQDGAAIAAVNKNLREIKSALSYAVDAGLIRANPLLRWKGMQLREPERSIRVVEADEFQTLLSTAPYDSLRSALIVAYRMGLRRSEICSLKWRGRHGEPLIDLEQRVLHVANDPDAGFLTKSRKNRSLPMHPDAYEVFSRLWLETPKVVANGRESPKYDHVFLRLDNSPFPPNWLSRTFTTLVKRSGIRSATLHDLRRSFSTLAQRAGVDRHVVKDLGGWSAVSVVEGHYTGDVSSVMKAAMDRIVAAG